MRRKKIITEYRQTGGDADADGDTIVGMSWRWGQCWWRRDGDRDDGGGDW